MVAVTNGSDYDHSKQGLARFNYVRYLKSNALINVAPEKNICIPQKMVITVMISYLYKSCNINYRCPGDRLNTFIARTI